MLSLILIWPSPKMKGRPGERRQINGNNYIYDKKVNFHETQ